MDFSFQKTYLAWTDRFLPEDRRVLDADGLRRARLALSIVVGVLGCCMISLTWLFNSEVYSNAVPVSLLALGMLAVPFLLRRTGSLWLTGHTIAGFAALALTVMVIQTGARAVPPLALLPGVPMVATLISGPRAGLMWAGISGALIAASFGFFRAGLQPRIELTESFLDQGRFMGAVFMLVFVFLVTYSYEHLKNHALRDLEEERARQIELRDQFLSHVSHELRTPIAAAQQFVSLVLDGVGGKVEDDQRELLEGALRNTSQLVQMIDGLVTMSRVRAGEPESELALHEVKLAGAIREAVDRHAQAADDRGLRVLVELPPDLPDVLAEERTIGAVLDHLLDNAVKFSPRDGQVVVSAAIEPPNEVEIAVKDEGPGIAPEQLREVFDGLHTGPTPEWRSRQGLGTGLVSARALVRAMHGQISVESRAGSGCRFRFTLSAVEPAGHNAA